MSKKPNTSRWTIMKYLTAIYAPQKRVEGHLTERTEKFYRDAINQLERFVGRPVRCCEITERMLERYIVWMVKRGLKKTTAFSRVHNLKGILRHWNPELYPPRRLGVETIPEFVDADCPDTLDHVIVNQYLPERMRITSAGTVKHYGRVIRLFGQFLGHAPTAADLTDNSVGKFLRWLVEVQELKHVSANGYVKQLKSLWTWMAKKRLVRNFPTIEDLPEATPLPVCWTKSELLTLMRACRAAKGTICGVPASAYWVAFHHVAWDTGERTGAMLSLRWDWLDWATGYLSAPAECRKGRKTPMVYALKPETLAALKAILEPWRDLIFERASWQNSFHLKYKALVISAGLKYQKGKTGPQKMRRTFASYIEAAGGNATKALKHRDRRVTEDSYLDPRVTDVESENKKLFPLDDGKEGAA